MIEVESEPSSPPSTACSTLVVVSNRLPVTRIKRLRGQEWKRSSGGLVSALTPILRDRRCAWIGWSGVTTEVDAFDLDGVYNVPVAMNETEVRDFYEGFCNSVLWPLYHDAIRKPQFVREWWQAFVRVNRRFADHAAAAAAPGATVWIHDYHLQLVPQMLRAQRPDVRIGFFLHVPFPPQELFAQIPWRSELLRGLLGADVVGFQTRVGAENFAQVCRRFAEAGGDGLAITIEGRTVLASSFPISIDFQHHDALARSAPVAARREDLRARLGRSRRLILGVDRLDYTKGIDIRLQAFRELLATHAEFREHCAFVQVAVPSRELVPEYRDIRRRVQNLVSEINGEYGEVGRTPVQYLLRGVTPVDLAALYSAAEVMLVTPLRDGMNLVCKEYVASRIDEDGALVLSEFTGAAKELDAALLVNPHDVDGLVRAMHTALTMPRAEQVARMQQMRAVVRNHDVHTWARSFFEALEAAHAV